MTEKTQENGPGQDRKYKQRADTSTAATRSSLETGWRGPCIGMRRRRRWYSARTCARAQARARCRAGRIVGIGADGVDGALEGPFRLSLGVPIQLLVPRWKFEDPRCLSSLLCSIHSPRIAMHDILHLPVIGPSPPSLSSCTASAATLSILHRDRLSLRPRPCPSTPRRTGMLSLTQIRQRFALQVRQVLWFFVLLVGQPQCSVVEHQRPVRRYGWQRRERARASSVIRVER